LDSIFHGQNYSGWHCALRYIFAREKLLRVTKDRTIEQNLNGWRPRTFNSESLEEVRMTTEDVMNIFNTERPRNALVDLNLRISSNKNQKLYWLGAKNLWL